jgi:acetoacetate decarboxylase
MSTALQSGTLHRMPVQFGPTPGPRQHPDGGRFSADVTRRAVRVSVPFRSQADALNALLPPGFRLDGEPIARFDAAYMTGIPWLAGRGYNTFGLIIPALWEGEETVAGDFVVVLFENLADPILSGREELGFNKLWCELPEVEVLPDAVRCRAAWLGYQFATLELTELDPQLPAAGGVRRPFLNYKYIPSSGRWGEADVAYATVAPNDGPVRVTDVWRAKATVEIAGAAWEDLPTLFRVINGIEALPREEILPATVTHTIGSGDFYGVRRLS